jgi:hypothetical protein
MGNKSMIFRFVQKSGIPGIPGLYRRPPRLFFRRRVFNMAAHGGGLISVEADNYSEGTQKKSKKALRNVRNWRRSACCQN